MKKIFILLFASIATISHSQIIPDSIRVDWSMAGFGGSVPQYSTIADVTAFGAIPNDTIDDYPAVANALVSLNNQSGVIYFPPGNYILKSSVNLPDSVIIRGAGSDSTTLTFNLNNTTANSFNIANGQSNSFTPLISGYAKGSKQLVVANASTLFSTGNDVEIREANGSWDTNPASWAAYSVGHLAKVDSVSGDTLWMNEALRINLDSALQPEIRKIIPKKMCGLECFGMTRIDSMATSVNYGVYFNYADHCWMRGIESYKSIGAHVTMETASHIYLSGCYFHESYIYDGISTDGYGVLMITHSCSNLVEDNIFRKLRHCMIAKQGANGNVLGYNYSLEPNRSESPANYGADLLLHGHYPFANLYEGNIGQNLDIDQTWGPAGPFNTFFRNKLELWGIIMTSGTVQSDRQNFVGNDVTNTTFPYGQYLLYGSNHFQYGNNIKGVITPSGTTSLTDTSYYLDSIPPHFWNIPEQLPSIGEPNNSSNDNNPALQRYINGGTLTLCGFHNDSIITHVPDFVSSPDSIGIEIKSCTIQNGKLEIIVSSNKEYSFATFEIFSSSGQRIFHQNGTLQQGVSASSFQTESGLVRGLYLIRIIVPSLSALKKVMVVQ